MNQRFYASPTDTFTYDCGAVGHRTGSGPFDCLGAFAKVRNCRVAGLDGERLTCYATGYADSWFSVPACTQYRGKYIGGFFMCDSSGITFHPYDRFKARLQGVTRGAPAVAA